MASNTDSNAINSNNIKAVLRDWYDVPHLAESPLVALHVVEEQRQASGYADTTNGNVRALKDVIIKVIDALKPDQDIQDPTEKRLRAYTIITERFINGYSLDYVQDSLGLGRSTVTAEQAKALEQMTTILNTMEDDYLRTNLQNSPETEEKRHRGEDRSEIPFEPVSQPLEVKKTIARQHVHDRFEGLEAYFTDREEIRSQFVEMIHAPHVEKRLWAMHGMGGVGKSSLLAMLQRYCQEHGVPVGFVSGDSSRSTLEVLLRWSNNLAETISMQSFQQAYASYLQIQATVSERMQQSEVENRLTDLWSNKNGVTNRESGLRTFLSLSEMERFLNSTNALTHAFLDDINRSAVQYRIVLMVDAYEKIQEIDDWLCDVVRQLPANVIVVIAGRTTVDWHQRWAGWLAHAQHYTLEPLSTHHTKLLIHRYYNSQMGSDFPVDQAEHILQFSKGLPLAATTAVRLWVKYGVQSFSMVEADVLHELVGQLRQGVATEFVPVLEAAAIVRYFNRTILRAIIGRDEVTDVFEELCQFPFTGPTVIGEQRVFRIHDRVREFLNEALLVDDPARFRSLHKRAADFFERELHTTDIYMSERWKHLAVEYVHHLLQADIEVGLQQLHQLYGRSIEHSAFEFCRTLIKESSSYTSSRKLVHRLKYYQILLTITESHWGLVDEQAFRELVKESDIYPETQWGVLYHFGLFLRFTVRLNEGEFYLEKSLEALKKAQLQGSAAECQVIGELAVSYKSLTKKRVLLERAIDIARKLEVSFAAYNVYTSLGSLYFYCGQYLNGLNLWREGLAFIQAENPFFLIADAYNRIALGLISLADFKNAETSLHMAMEAAQQLPDVLGARHMRTTFIKRHWGVLQYAQGNYEEAVQYFTESVEGKRAEKSTTGRLRTEVLLAECLYKVGRVSEVQSRVHELDRLADIAGIGDFASRWHVLYGHILLDSALNNNVGDVDVEPAIARYTKALMASLQENSYALDDAMTRIFWKLHSTNSPDNQSRNVSVLNAIASFWQTGEIDGVLLTELEQRIRTDAYEINEEQRISVMAKIESALLNGIPSAEPKCWQGL